MMHAYQTSLLFDSVQEDKLSNMDAARTQKTKTRLDDLRQEVIDLNASSDIKNAFIHTVGILEDIREDAENAHLRIDHRKKEHEEVMGKLTKLELELKKSNELQARINDNLVKQNEEADKTGKRRWLFMVIVTVVMLANTFGSFKGASIASSIWNALKVVI